ncbi:YozD family protein [Bacillus pumilus]|uniref:YozD family protein n=1 Tax=Bacillus pumilus TaxID=1408 RepID=UPI00345ED64B
MKEADLVIDTEEIAEFFYMELVKRGYIPTDLETFELADITFEYMLRKAMIVEEEAW